MGRNKNYPVYWLILSLLTSIIFRALFYFLQIKENELKYTKNAHIDSNNQTAFSYGGNFFLQFYILSIKLDDIKMIKRKMFTIFLKQEKNKR